MLTIIYVLYIALALQASLYVSRSHDLPYLGCLMLYAASTYIGYLIYIVWLEWYTFALICLVSSNIGYLIASTIPAALKRPRPMATHI